MVPYMTAVCMTCVLEGSMVPYMTAVCMTCVLEGVWFLT